MWWFEYEAPDRWSQHPRRFLSFSEAWFDLDSSKCLAGVETTHRWNGSLAVISCTLFSTSGHVPVTKGHLFLFCWKHIAFLNPSQIRCGLFCFVWVQTWLHTIVVRRWLAFDGFWLGERRPWLVVNGMLVGGTRSNRYNVNSWLITAHMKRISNSNRGRLLIRSLH